MTPRKRVLLVLDRSAGGIARHVAQLTEMMDGHDGLEIDVAGPSGLPLVMPKPMLPLEIPDGPIRGHRRAIATLRSYLQQQHYDVIHAHGLRAGIDAGLAARGSDTKRVVTVHNLVHKDVAGKLKAPIYRRAESMVVRSNDVVLCVSEEIGKRLHRAAPRVAHRVAVLHLGIGAAPSVSKSRDEVRSLLQVSDDQSLLVTASRLAPQKALHVMIEAVGRMKAPAALAILGEGPLEGELRAEAERLGVGNRVSFLGFRDDLADQVAAADVFCLSSVWEGVPLSAQEAILLSTPIVATDVGGMGELIRDGYSGWLVPPGDPTALASAIDEVLAEPERARSFSDRAREELRRNFSTEKMLERLREIYSDDHAP